MLSEDFFLPSSAFGRSLLFLFRDQCAIFLFLYFFFLKVHLLNPWWLSLQTIPYHVINPLGVSFRSNDIL